MQQDVITNVAELLDRHGSSAVFSALASCAESAAEGTDGDGDIPARWRRIAELIRAVESDGGIELVDAAEVLTDTP